MSLWIRLCDHTYIHTYIRSPGSSAGTVLVTAGLQPSEPLCLTLWWSSGVFEVSIQLILSAVAPIA